MDDAIYVSCHAPSLSLILFDTVRSSNDQIGLLIGEVCNDVISKTTDDNEVHQEKKTAIYIEHCEPITNNLVGNCGIIDEEILQQYIETYGTKIIGWYSFRKNSRAATCSMRDTLVHKALLKALNVNPNDFVVALLSTGVVAGRSTHSYSHVFMRYATYQRCFETLRLKIYTLSDKCVNNNGYTMNNTLPTSFKFCKITNTRSDDTPVQYVRSIHKEVTATLNRYSERIQKFDNDTNRLEDDIEQLKVKLGLDKKPVVIRKPPTIEPKDELVEPLARCFPYNPAKVYSAGRKNHPFGLLNIEEKMKLQLKQKQEPEPEDQAVCIPVQHTAKPMSYAASVKTTDKSDFHPKLRPGIGPLPNSNLSSGSRRSPDVFPNNSGGSQNSQQMNSAQNSLEY